MNDNYYRYFNFQQNSSGMADPAGLTDPVTGMISSGIGASGVVTQPEEVPESGITLPAEEPSGNDMIPPTEELPPLGLEPPIGELPPFELEPPGNEPPPSDFETPTGGRPPFESEPLPGRRPPSGIMPPSSTIPSIYPPNLIQLILQNCTNGVVYVWMRNGDNFWFYPYQLASNTVSGYHWNPQTGWFNSDIPLANIQSLTCVQP